MPLLPPNDEDQTMRTFVLPRRGVLSLLGGGVVFAVTGTALLAKDGDDDDDDDDDDTRDDDHSGHGRGGDDDRDDEDVVTVEGTVPAGSAEVTIVDDDPNGFSPGTITIDPGQSVTWVNSHDDAHTATGIGFDTGIMQPGTLATVTFDRPGTFPYACQIHPEMTGIVEVRGAAATPDDATPAATPAAGGASETVTISNIAFSPAEITVPMGSTITWTNEDPVDHTATAEDGQFDTGVIAAGQSASVTFDQAGAFTYICAFHPTMSGTVIVTGA
jgi:plastocyanin